MIKALFKLTLPVAVLFSVSIMPEATQAQAEREYQLKAGFILNFLKLTSFPRHTDSLVLCVSGPAGARQALTRLAGTKIKKRSLAVVESSDSRGCDALYLAGKLSDADWQRVRDATSTSMLSIGDDDSFTKQGGMIQFYVVENKIRFEVNTLALERTKMRVSSRLLRLARIVRY